MQPEHIAVLVPYTFVPPKNGGQKAAYGLCDHLSRQKKTTAISTPGNKAEMAAFPLLPLFGKSVFRYVNPITLLRLYQFITRNKVSKVIAFQPFISLLAYIPSRLSRITLSIYVQNIEYQRFRSIKKWYWPIVFLVEGVAMRLADQLYFISPDEIEPGKRAFGLSADKCSVLPFGVSVQALPDPVVDRQAVRDLYGYPEDLYLIVFFGPLSYQPNLEALEKIITQIEPALSAIADFPYRFLICGGGLPDNFSGLSHSSNIDYLGFVEDIETLVQACDLMVNPITSGGGVKTKVIESISLGVTVISTLTGALGIDSEACGSKLIGVPDHDYQAFARAIAKNIKKGSVKTPDAFFKTYYWGNIVKNV
jgi:glycosyltransferase involved in cell wall biosynthesis